MEYGKFIVLDSPQYLPFITAVNKCVSDDITRYFMNQMYFTEGKLIGTDGRRLAMYECEYLKDALKEGQFYRVLKVSKKYIWIVEVFDCGEFPNYKRIIPDDPENPPKKTLKFSTSKKQDIKSAEWAKLLTGFPEPTGLNIQFINDLPVECEYVVHWRDSKHDLVFETGYVNGYGKYTEIIMPVMLD